MGAVLHLPFPTPQRAPEVGKPADCLLFPTPPKTAWGKKAVPQMTSTPHKKVEAAIRDKEKDEQDEDKDEGGDGGKEAREDDVIIRYQLSSSNPDDNDDEGEGDNEGEDGKDEDEEGEEKKDEGNKGEEEKDEGNEEPDPDTHCRG
ncbi:hypothetical protein DFH09DRAFT_1314135 [Mycena vulgaris]|nr:hypothetical protein DFH09DRAFT_1314135 [Mycena vulgaris]